MVSFVTRTEEVQGAGIGDQRVINKQRPSVAATVEQVGATLNKAVDRVGDSIADSTAQEIVRDAQSQIDSERAELERLNQEVPNNTVQDVDRGIKTLEQGVASRQISRENAKIRAQDLVTKAIQDQPLFKDKIRKSAENLLGFSLESEASRQFFSTFETQAQLSSGQGVSGMTALEKEALGLSRVLGISLNKAYDIVGEREMLEIQTENIQNRMKRGDTSSEGAFRELSNIDSRTSTNAVFAEVLKLREAGEEINENTWRQVLDVNQQSFLADMEQQLEESGLSPTSQVMQRFREETIERYNQTFDSVKNLDSAFLTKQNIERLITAQQAYGMQALPVFTMLKNTVGERFATRALDIIDRANGDPTVLKALFKNSPALGRVMTLVGQEPNALADGIKSAFSKLSNEENLNELDLGIIDLMGSSIFKELPSGERTNVVESLQSKGLPTKAASIIAGTNFSSSTPEERRIFKRSWDNSQTALTTSIGNKMKEARSSLSDRGATLSVTDSGFLSLRTRAMTPSGLVNTSAVDHPAWDEVQKLNMYLHSFDRGWGNELKIESKQATAQALVSLVNKASEPEPGTPEATQSAFDELKRTNPERARLIMEAAGVQ